MNKDELKKILDGNEGAYLRGAYLQDADLRCTSLRGADLRRAYLRGADLRSADLRGADLRGSNLENANLENADLRGAKLEHACTHGMKTDAATRIDWPMVCPETGAFVAWKQAGEYIVKLEIPEDAERSSATTNKCRASMARVLEIQNMVGTRLDVTKAKSNWGKVYKVGKMVYPDEWDYNRWNECSHGIHFFMTRYEAVEW